MKKVIKWTSIGVGILVLLVIAALIIVPMFVDIQKYKPEIEKKVSDAVGRPFTIGGELKLSLFPWAGIAFTDLHLGNPPGFEEKDFVSVNSFDVKVKLIPLISKDIQVQRFVLKGPRIALIKSKAGRGNWEGIGKPSKKVPAKDLEKKTEKPEGKVGEGIPLKSLAVGKFAITKGSVLWIDHAKGDRKEISDIALHLKDVSFDNPIKIEFSALLDGRPLALNGSVGPVGKDPGKGTVPLDFTVKALKQIDMGLKGKIVNPATRPQFDLALQVSPFSPRKLMADLKQAFPVVTADPKALTRVALKTNLKGDQKNVSISDGSLDLDESKLKFTLKASEFSKPNIMFDLNLDKIDLDRYLPPPSEKKGAEEKKKAEAPAVKKKVDYTPLRKLILDGIIRVGNLKANQAKIQDVHLKVVGKNGKFRLDPLSLKLYQGDVTSKGILDVGGDTPKSNMNLDAKGIQVGPLLKDVMKKEFLEGTFKTNASISMQGDDPDRIKKTLNGRGDMVFTDGAIVGIDLAGMVRNIKAKFGMGEAGGQKPRTDFSELNSPFTITNGVVNTPNTSMKSPLLRVIASGNADLVKETLDFRVEPKAVFTLKGQGDTKERSGIMVPVLVTGTFDSPKFRPDLKGMVKGLTEGISKPSDLKKILPGQGGEEETVSKPLGGKVEEKVKGLLKSLPFGK
jgi:AsmA protein